MEELPGRLVRGGQSRGKSNTYRLLYLQEINNSYYQNIFSNKLKYKYLNNFFSSYSGRATFWQKFSTP